MEWSFGGGGRLPSTPLACFLTINTFVALELSGHVVHVVEVISCYNLNMFRLFYSFFPLKCSKLLYYLINGLSNIDTCVNGVSKAQIVLQIVNLFNS
jgi:hypothetical protein